MCSKLTLKTPERRYWCFSAFFTVNFEHISHLVLVFVSLALSRQMPVTQLYLCFYVLNKHVDKTVDRCNVYT